MTPFARAVRNALTPLLFVLFAWLAVACGGRTDDAASTATSAGGSVGGAGKSGASQAGASGAAGASGTSGGAGKAGTSGAAGKSGAAGAAGKAGASGSAGSSTVVSVSVSPADSTISIGTSVALTATALSSDGSKTDVTASATWSSSGASATVASGKVTGVSAGAVSITAAFGGKSGTAKVAVSSATPTKLTVTPATATLPGGGTTQLTAILSLSDGTTQDVTKTAVWSSSAASVAGANDTGLVTAAAPGTATITATSAGLSASATITVTAATLTSLAITPTSPTVLVGGTQALVATGTFSDGSVADVTTTAAWSSSDGAILAIDAAGLAKGLAEGTSIVTASLSGVTASTAVTVTAAKVTSLVVSPAAASVAVGGSAQLTAQATFSNGSTADVTAAATWSSSDATKASVSNAGATSGLVSGLAAGSTTITATFGGAAATATVTVVAGTLTSVVVSPAAPSVPVGATMKLAAIGHYDDGSTLDVTASATWSTDDGAIAQVGNGATAGALTGVALGTTSVTAVFGGLVGTAPVTVTAATLASITVSPATASLAVGKKQQLTATAVFSDGTTIDATEQAVWSSSSDAVAGVTNAAGVRGQVTAIAAGDATITATYMGLSGTASVSVTKPVVSQLVVSPTNQTRHAGQNLQYQAVAILDNGTQQNVTLMASWSSSNPAAATIGGMGQAHAVAAGTTTITATWSGLTASTMLTVTDPALDAIAVSPINPSLPVGTPVPFSATAIFTDGTSNNITQQCTWSSSDTKVATVVTTMMGGPGMGGGMKGTVTPVSAGTATITCNYMGLSGTSTVTVTAAVVDSLVVSPGAATGAVGATQQFTAQVIYSDGTSMDVTQAATWQSDAPAFVTVTTAGGGPGGMQPRGLATAVSAGTATITATYMGLSATAQFVVTSATLTSIVIDPPNPSTPVGVNVKLNAFAIYSDGTSLNVTNAGTWVSSDPSVAGVSNQPMGNQKGLVTPIKAGTTTITVTAMGLSAQTTVTVESATLVAIEVTPFAPTLPIGYTTPFQATGIYSDNSTLDLTGLVTWQSSAPGIATVSTGNPTKGRVDPIAAGATTITATYQGVTGQTTLTVTDATLQSIVVTPDAASLAVGQTLAFKATGDFGGGLTLDVTAYVTWFSSDTGVAQISNAAASRGQAKALAAGTTSISAVKGGITGQTTLTVP